MIADILYAVTAKLRRIPGRSSSREQPPSRFFSNEGRALTSTHPALEVRSNPGIPMNRSKISKRVNNALEEGIENIREIASQVEERLREEASAVAGSTRKGFCASKKALVEAEETVADHIKEHPAPYIIAAISLLVFLVGKAILDKRTRTDWR